jgi:putative transposase
MAKPAARGDVSLIFFDALRVKIRDEGLVRNQVYVALGVTPDGTNDILGP